MGRFPIFQSPELDDVEKRMRPCETFRHAFLGNDSRKLIQILNVDESTIKALGLTHERIAQELRGFTDEAKKALGGPVIVADKFHLQAEAARGRIPCPWAHPGLYDKTHVVLTNMESGETLVWSELAVHMIEEHGFYQGKGSPYRIDPAAAKRILEL